MSYDAEDRDIARIRLRLIDLIKSFFLQEPDGEILGRWRGVFSALAAEPVNADLDRAVARLVELLEDMKLSDIQAEYYTLFSDPFSDHTVSLSASYYADGRSHGQTLADFRGFLKRAGIRKAESVKDTEDSLPVMADCLARLIDLEKSDFQGARDLQQELITNYLAPLAASLAAALEVNEQARFYQAGGRFLVGYVEIDQALFEAA